MSIEDQNNRNSDIKRALYVHFVYRELFILFSWLQITDDDSIHGMRVCSILVTKSNIRWFILHND